MSKTTHPKSEDASSSAIDAVNNLVDQVTKLVGPAPSLSVADVRRSAKLRKGAEKVIPTITALSDQLGLALPSTATTATILAKLKQAQDLVPLHKKMTSALKQIEDVIFAAGSESWAGATVHYTVLKRLAKKNGDLEANLAPVREFFAQRNPEIVTQEKETKAVRKAAQTSTAAAKAAATLAAIQGAPAPVSQPTAAKATAVSPAPSAAPATPAPTSAPIA
jgi:ABC-type Fe3+-citrate transport system substrate-binding protein